MAALNQAKIIKGLEEITAQGADRFFFKFLKLYGFSKLTIQKLEQNDRVRNIGLRDGDYGLAKQIYFCESIPGGGYGREIGRTHPESRAPFAQGSVLSSY